MGRDKEHHPKDDPKVKPSFEIKFLGTPGEIVLLADVRIPFKRHGTKFDTFVTSLDEFIQEFRDEIIKKVAREAGVQVNFEN